MICIGITIGISPSGALLHTIGIGTIIGIGIGVGQWKCTIRYYSTYTDQLLVSEVLFTLRKSERDIFDYCRCLMLTLNCILCEPIWKRCRFRFFFRSNITEPLRYRLKVLITTVSPMTLTVPGCWWASPRPGTGASRAEPGWLTWSSTTPDSTDSTSPGTHACPSLSWMLT